MSLNSNLLKLRENYLPFDAADHSFADCAEILHILNANFRLQSFGMIYLS